MTLTQIARILSVRVSQATARFEEIAKHRGQSPELNEALREKMNAEDVWLMFKRTYGNGPVVDMQNEKE